jgi:glutamine amidotransferase
MICIIDSGTGNLHSLSNGLRSMGMEVEVITDPPRERPEVLLLPGVGAFGHASAELERRGWDRAIKGFVLAGSRLVGICLGMQLLFHASEEGPGARGLGLLPGTVRRLDASFAKVPHIGWAKVRYSVSSQVELPWAYFVHSFTVSPDDPAIVKAWTTHGARDFPAIVRFGRIAGVQFHPEKSQRPGLEFLAALVRGEP